MKIGFQVEGATDAVILPGLVAKILGRKIDVHTLRRRAGGVGEVLRTLEASVMDAWRHGCAALVVHADGDSTTPHYEHGAGDTAGCRYCRIRQGVPKTPRPYNANFRVLVGVPIKELEAWLLRIAGRRFIGRAQDLPPRRAKELLWGRPGPDRQTVLDVWSDLLPRLGLKELTQLADAQPSFASFRDEVRGLATKRGRGAR